MLSQRLPLSFLTTKNSILLRWICLALTLGCWSVPVNLAIAQDQNVVSSRRENSVMAAVETAGGKVFQISAAGPEREISFYLSAQPIRDEHLLELNAIQNVIWLNLAGTEISNAGLKNLQNMPLKKLHLERTQIGDEGMPSIATLVGLEYLNLYGTKVTDAGLEQLKDLKNLQKVYVWQSAVTAEGMQKMRDSIPGCEVIGEVTLVIPVVEEPKSADAKPEEAKTEEPKSADAKPEEPQAEEPQAEEPKPESDGGGKETPETGADKQN